MHLIHCQRYYRRLHIMSTTLADTLTPVASSSIDPSTNTFSADHESVPKDQTNVKKRCATDDTPDDIPVAKRRCGTFIPYHQSIQEHEQEDDNTVAHQLLDPRLMPTTHAIIFVCSDPRFQTKRNFVEKIAAWTRKQCEKYLAQDENLGQWTDVYDEQEELEDVLRFNTCETNFFFVNVKSTAERWLSSTMDVMLQYVEEPNTYVLIPEHLMSDDRHVRYTHNRPNIPGFYDMPSARNAAFRTSTFPYGGTEWSCIPTQSFKHYFFAAEFLKEENEEKEDEEVKQYTQAQEAELEHHWSLLVTAYTQCANQDVILHTRSEHDEQKGQVSEADQMYNDLRTFATYHDQFYSKLPTRISPPSKN